MTKTEKVIIIATITNILLGSRANREADLWRRMGEGQVVERFMVKNLPM